MEFVPVRRHLISPIIGAKLTYTREGTARITLFASTGTATTFDYEVRSFIHIGRFYLTSCDI
jgi:hypothetical protein